MPSVQAVIFRKLTDTDFFNINKPRGTESGGGGQSYIDIPTSAVSPSQWRDFFSGQTAFEERGGIGWNVSIRSLGVNLPAQDVKIAQRRETSFSIREQKLSSRASNRVYAWHPEHTDFPMPENPAIRSHVYDLHIYITKLDNGEYWAGWFQRSSPESTWAINEKLNQLFVGDAGYLKFNGQVLFEISDAEWPFRLQDGALVSEPSITSDGEERKVSEKVLFDEDEIDTRNESAAIKESIRRIRKRNSRAVRVLKELYNNTCQLTGTRYTFQKSNGEYYCEAHHLLPLGEGGADNVHNIVIVSPLIHRMFHHATVEGLDLSRIQNNKLQIRINGKEYEIKWHPEHARVVQSANSS